MKEVVVKQNATAEQLKHRKTLAAAEREENQRFASLFSQNYGTF